MLAICRGMQALNVARGGTLHQHLPDLTELEHRQRHAPHEPAHAVTSPPARRCTASRAAAGSQVNTFHHQAIDELGAGLEVIAQAPDGTIEARPRPEPPLLPRRAVARRAAHAPPEHAPVVRAPDRGRAPPALDSSLRASGARPPAAQS